MVIVITGIVVAVGGTMLTSGTRAYLAGTDLTELDWQSRIAALRLARDLRTVRSASAADLVISPADQITFVNVDGDTLSYTLSGTTLMRNGQPLADGVTALAFSYLRADARTTAANAAEVFYITADLTLVAGAAARDLRVTVFPRAF